jgi:hypothetical protein
LGIAVAHNARTKKPRFGRIANRKSSFQSSTSDQAADDKVEFLSTAVERFLSAWISTAGSENEKSPYDFL